MNKDVYDIILEAISFFNCIPDGHTLIPKGIFVEKKPEELWKDSNGKIVEIVKPEGFYEDFELPNFKFPESSKDFDVVFNRQYKIFSSTDPEKFRTFQIDTWNRKLNFLESSNYAGAYSTIELVNKYIMYLNLKREDNKYTELLGELKEYITGINAIDFEFIIEHHSLTPGTKPATWIGKPVDAHRFMTISKMTLPMFNKCFSFSDGRKLKHNDKDKAGLNDNFVKLLSKYLNK